MMKTNSDGFITWNRGLLYRGTAHLKLRSDCAQGGSHGLGLRGNLDGEFFGEDEKKGRKSLEFFLKFLMFWTQRSMKKKIV